MPLDGLDAFSIDPMPQKMMQWHEIPVGSLLKRRDVHAGLVWHFGIKYDDWHVAHIDKNRQTGLIQFRTDTSEGFAAGKLALVDYLAPLGAVDSVIIYQRAQAIANSRAKFDLLSVGDGWNCEDVARYLATGIKRSLQAETASKVGLVAIGLLFLASLDG